MRRTLLSCTSLARHGVSGLVAAILLPFGTAAAGDLAIADTISAWLDLNHQEFAVLTTALALLGFSVVAAILLDAHPHPRRTQRIAAACRDRGLAGARPTGCVRCCSPSRRC